MKNRGPYCYPARACREVPGSLDGAQLAKHGSLRDTAIPTGKWEASPRPGVHYGGTNWQHRTQELPAQEGAGGEGLQLACPQSSRVLGMTAHGIRVSGHSSRNLQVWVLAR